MVNTGNKTRETVLYYNPDPQNADTAKLKGVLVGMKIRIRNIRRDQVQETVGSLLGIEEPAQDKESGPAADMTEEMLVMYGFASQRVDELLQRLRKAGVPKIALKAVVTGDNRHWSFEHLYRELEEEHRAMSGPGRPEAEKN